MKYLKSNAFLLLALVFALKSSILAAEFQGDVTPYFFYTSPPTPVGSGARAMGVGGAFIAVADDGTAANWNPAALIQLELPEASMVLDGDFRTIDGQSASLYDVNYLSGSYPFTVKDINMIISFNYQRLYDYNLNFKNNVEYAVDDSGNQATWLVPGNGNPASVTQYDVVTMSGLNEKKNSEITADNSGELGALSPAFAIQVTPKFSLGITANFWKDGWLDRGREYQSRHEEKGNGESRQVNYLWYDSDGDCTCNGGKPCSPNDYIDDLSCVDELIDPAKLGNPNPLYSNPKTFQFDTIVSQRMRMQGESYNLGLLWDISPRWTMGAVYRTGAELNVDREIRQFQHQTSAWASLNQAASVGEFNYDEKIYLPSSYGLGAGFRYSDALTISADVTMMRWDEYNYELEDGTRYSLITGLKQGINDVDPTLTGRIGAEYLIIKPKYVVPIRGGLFYDQEPALDRPDSFYGLTVGSGFAYKWLVMDIAYFYRFGRDVAVGYAANAERTELMEQAKGDVDQHQVMLSGIVHMP